MKKLCTFLVCAMLFLCIAVPCSAADAGAEEVIYYKEETLDGGITIITTVTVPAIQARASTKTATARQEYTRSGATIAVIAVTGTFRYDGTTVSVVSKTVSQTDTYDGWSYSQSSFTSSGGTITLTGKLTKFLSWSVPVEITLSCDKNGNISK